MRTCPLGARFSPHPRKERSSLSFQNTFSENQGPLLWMGGQKSRGSEHNSPTRAPCLLRAPATVPTSHGSQGPTRASGPGLGPPRRRGAGGERRRRRGSGVGRRLPRAAVGGLFRGEEPARGRIAPRRRLPAPVPHRYSRPGARAPTPGAAPCSSPSALPALNMAPQRVASPR